MFKQKVQSDIEMLDVRIKNYKQQIEKRSRKTLDLIADEEKLKSAYEKDLEELNNLTKGK